MLIDLLFLIVATVIGLLVGIFIGTRGKTCGTLVINKESKTKPFFELHIEDDPLKYKTGSKINFTLDIR